MAEPKARTAIIVSGRGSNMSALIDAAAKPDYPAEIALVLCNRADAKGLAIARERGIATVVADKAECSSKAEMEARFDAALSEAGIEIICLAGFMRILSAAFVERWRDSVLNIHPSLLPLFPGLHTHERALAAGVKLHGATVHVVRAELDSGPIVAQGAVAVFSGDTPESLAARVLAIEHRIYPLALKLFASGRAKVTGDIVEIDGAVVDPNATLLSPPD